MDKIRKSLDDSFNEANFKYSRSNKENLNNTITIETAAVRDVQPLDETSSFEVVSELAKLGERVDYKRQQLSRLYDEIKKSINEDELTYVTIEPEYHNVSLAKTDADKNRGDSFLDETVTRIDDDEELWNLRKKAMRPSVLKLPVAQINFQTTSMLKQVHFETIPFDEDEKPSKPLSTVSKQMAITPSRPSTSVHSTSKKTSPANALDAKKTASQTLKTRALPPTKSPVKTTKIVSTKTISKSPTSLPVAKIPTSKNVDEGKRSNLKAADEKAKLTKTLGILRIKVIRRKYAYIWLRKYFYSNKAKAGSQRLLLPSQAE